MGCVLNAGQPTNEMGVSANDHGEHRCSNDHSSNQRANFAMDYAANNRPTYPPGAVRCRPARHISGLPKEQKKETVALTNKH